ncbi:hypothetical protein DACRYDRAFT_117763 [Dacryopinax primogenitus]|uniref:Trypsin-like serine protease n=1 Tax=Dacryopinax primogenitus (strain DJM 731) TaxID=1858805 RepID=M5G6Z7_DACPD|nr:uncharacterized protein DACRYDRAFT_117763 [Dacryopinax primogenitus]EJT99532.1 hypothetical protein DACRYDRAFT_117763 [Dacryopinax primogenitus]
MHRPRRRLRTNDIISPVYHRRCLALPLPASALPPNLPPVPDAPGYLPPTSTPTPSPHSPRTVNPLDAYILARFQRLRSSACITPLRRLLTEYNENSSRVLPEYLPYEPSPPKERRVDFHQGQDGGTVLVAHVIADPKGEEKVIVCSGFPIRTRYAQQGERGGRTLIVSCTHTLEQVRFLAPPDAGGTTLIFTSLGRAVPATAIPSSLPNRDLTLLSIPQQAESYFHPLPVSPYPLPEEAEIGVHNSAEEAGGQGWERWINGKLWRRWAMGRVEGYKDQAWREAKPGTYDHLAHLVFLPLPTASSSGGPIMASESGAVIGIIIGDRVEGVRGQKGWAVPAEAVFEMFSLPGLVLKKGK